MALFDFMSQPVSGQYAQGPTQTGQAGVGQGMTWAQLLSAIASLSSDPGARQTVDMMNRAGQPRAGFTAPVFDITQPPQGQGQQNQKQTSASEFGAIMNLFGIGV